MSHLVFYDGECPLCLNSVKLILKFDSKGEFLFAPLQGTTAKRELVELFAEEPGLDSLVMIENYGGSSVGCPSRIYVQAEGALRIAWYLGGWWRLIGIFSFLPGWMFNWIYRLIAANRYRLFFLDKNCLVQTEKNKDRFLM